MFSSPVFIKDRDLQHLCYILDITESLTIRKQSLHGKVYYLQGEHSVPVWVQVPVDSLSPGVAVTKLQGHIGVAGPSEVGRAKAASPNNLHCHEANILSLLEGLIQTLHRMLVVRNIE